MFWRTNGHPQYDSAAKLNFIIFLAGSSNLFIDFLFLYVPSIGIRSNSLKMDMKLGFYISIFRSVADLAFLGMIIKFYNKNTPSEFHALRRQRSAKKPKNSKSLFILSLIAILPIPQVIIGLKNPEWIDLFWVILVQIPFRALALSPYSKRAGTLMNRHMIKNAWHSEPLFTLHTSVSFNFAATHIYKNLVLQLLNGMNWLPSVLKKFEFAFGVNSDANTNKIGTRSFIQKYTYCLAWGLKSYSSFGQILSANSDASDTFFSLLIIVFGLILFGDLLARMQTGLQCVERKEDKQRARQRMVDEWMKYHQLPQPLKKQVKQAIQSEWSATQGTDDEAILDSFHGDIKSEIRRHLYLEIIRTMPLFEEMDDDLVNAICGYLRTFSSNKGTYVAFEGEPVHQMLFVFSGKLEVSYANSSGKCITLGPGDLCGKELLEWCSHPTTSTKNFKSATQTIQCTTDVDAFALRVDDVKLLAIQFHRDGKFRRAFQRYTA